MGGFLDMLPTILGHVDGVTEATVHGGGVPFEDFGPRIVRGIDRGNTPSQLTFLLTRWLPGVPGLVPRLEKGIRVADVGCGSGTVPILMAQGYPNCEVVGYDVSAHGIAEARSRAAGIADVVFLELAVEEIPTDPPFGLITSFDVIHDLADPPAGLRRIR